MMLVNSIYIHNLYISTYKKYVYVFLLMGQTLKLASKESPCSSAGFPAYSILCTRIRWTPFTQHKDSTLHRENCGPGVQACAAEFVAGKVSVPFPGHSAAQQNALFPPNWKPRRSATIRNKFTRCMWMAQPWKKIKHGILRRARFRLFGFFFWQGIHIHALILTIFLGHART